MQDPTTEIWGGGQAFNPLCVFPAAGVTFLSQLYLGVLTSVLNVMGRRVNLMLQTSLGKTACHPTAAATFPAAWPWWEAPVQQGSDASCSLNGLRRWPLPAELHVLKGLRSG